jgi:hypothetical protein
MPRKRKSRKRSLAAKRGWITRRRNARKKFSGNPPKRAKRKRKSRKRSLAAKRGWITRRRNARKKFSGNPPKRANRRAGKKRGGPPTSPSAQMAEYLATLDYRKAKKGAIVVEVEVIERDKLTSNQVIDSLFKMLTNKDQWLKRFSKNSWKAVKIGLSIDREPSYSILKITRSRRK